MKKIVVSLIILLSFSKMVSAQDSLMVYDISVTMSPVMPAPSVGALPSSPTSVGLTAAFRINQPDSTAEVYIQIGIAPDGTEFLNQTLSVMSHSPGNHCLHTGITEISVFWGKATAYTTTVPMANMTGIKWLTIQAKDLAGNYTVKKYFKIQ